MSPTVSIIDCRRCVFVEALQAARKFVRSGIRVVLAMDRGDPALARNLTLLPVQPLYLKGSRGKNAPRAQPRPPEVSVFVEFPAGLDPERRPGKYLFLHANGRALERRPVSIAHLRHVSKLPPQYRTMSPVQCFRQERASLRPGTKIAYFSPNDTAGPLQRGLIWKVKDANRVVLRDKSILDPTTDTIVVVKMARIRAKGKTLPDRAPAQQESAAKELPLDLPLPSNGAVDRLNRPRHRKKTVSKPIDSLQLPLMDAPIEESGRGSHGAPVDEKPQHKPLNSKKTARRQPEIAAGTTPAETPSEAGSLPEPDTTPALLSDAAQESHASGAEMSLVDEVPPAEGTAARSKETAPPPAIDQPSDSADPNSSVSDAADPAPPTQKDLMNRFNRAIELLDKLPDKSVPDMP